MNPKNWIKRLLRPLTRRAYWRIDNRIREQLAPVEQSAAEAKLSMDRSVPTILSAMSTHNATARMRAREFETMSKLLRDLQGNVSDLTTRMGRLEQRVEFVRREAMFEARYNTGESPAQEIETRILRPNALADGGEPIRINLGAGHIPLPGYLNVDSRPLDGIDIVCDVRHLPFEKDSMTEIFSAHFLEHFPIEELRRSLLPYLISLLKHGGLFVAVVPDMETMVKECAAGHVSYSDLFSVTYGDQEYEGDFHFTGFTPESLGALLEDCGLGRVKVRDAARRNGLCYEFEIEATRSAAFPEV